MPSTLPITPTEKTRQRPEKAPLRADSEFVWSLTSHCCRICFGRILVRETFDRRKVYRCSCCETEAEGHSEKALCCCGLKLKTGVDAGVRCVVNEDPTPEFPARVIARQVDPHERK